MAPIAASGLNLVGGAGITTTTETIVGTTPIIPVPRDSETCLVIGHVLVQPGTGTTSVQTRVRRGATLADTLINSPVTYSALTVGLTTAMPHMVIDTVSGLATVQYSLTVQQVGATANGVMQGGMVVVVFFL